MATRIRYSTVPFEERKNTNISSDDGKKNNILSVVNPELAKEWHPTKNGSLTPDMVTTGSGKKVWWLGKCGHEWQESVVNRKMGQGCPYCSGHRVLEGFNDLATIKPSLAAEWHLTKNGELTPKMVAVGSNKKVWWLGNCGHEWRTTVNNRSRGSGCPYCIGQKILKGFNDLATTHPNLAAEWHPYKNGNLTPDMVSKGYDKKVWWLGKCGHEWQAAVCSRSSGRGCPVCWRESKTSFAEQSIFFYIKIGFLDAVNQYSLFGKEVDIYIPSIQTAVEYDGIFYHKNIDKDLSKNDWCKEHQVRLIRVREKGCPNLGVDDVIIRDNQNDNSLEEVITSLLSLLGVKTTDVNISRDRSTILNNYIFRKKNKSLQSACSDLASEWHPSKNGNLRPEMFTQNSNKVVWWYGKCGHEWKESINNRTSKKCGCPYCANKRVLKGFNDLATINQRLSSEWHPTKNNELTPYMFMPGSRKKVWWLGKCGHEWDANICDRSNGKGCPYCAGKRVLKGFNDLSTLEPILAAEWHPTKNGSLTPDMVTVGSIKKVWWLGKCGHEWDAIICHRSQGLGCPYCAGKRVLKGFNDLYTLKPALATEWHPTKNNGLRPDMVSKCAGKKVWWLDKYGHEWIASIDNRNKGQGCPFCSGKRVLKGFNDLATLHPEFAAEWHPMKNGKLAPDMVTAGSGKKVWWKCKEGHEWQAIIANRTGRNQRCPICARPKRKV